MATIILKCTCTHEYQDKLYGPGRRVHNGCKMLTGHGHRCTVCGNKVEATHRVVKDEE